MAVTDEEIEELLNAWFTPEELEEMSQPDWQPPKREEPTRLEGYVTDPEEIAARFASERDKELVRGQFTLDATLTADDEAPLPSEPWMTLEEYDATHAAVRGAREM